MPFSTYCKEINADYPLRNKKGDNLEELLDELDLMPLSVESKPSRKTAKDMRSFMRKSIVEFDR